MRFIAEIPTRPEDLRILQATLNEALKPFVSMKTDVLSIAIPTITMFPDGHIESRYSDDVEAHLAKIDDAWEKEVAWIMKQCGYQEPIR